MEHGEINDVAGIWLMVEKTNGSCGVITDMMKVWLLQLWKIRVDGRWGD